MVANHNIVHILGGDFRPTYREDVKLPVVAIRLAAPYYRFKSYSSGHMFRENPDI